MTREEAIGKLRGLVSSCPLKHDEWQAIEVAIEALKERPHGEWIPLEYNDDEKVTHTNFPYELDGSWVLVTDGKRVSIERIKKDIPDDHFFPNGRWFELNDAIAWMPIPKPYVEEGEEE